jgi:hypothetical protein
MNEIGEKKRELFVKTKWLMRQNELERQFRQGQGTGRIGKWNFYELLEVKKRQTGSEKLLALI